MSSGHQEKCLRSCGRIKELTDHIDRHGAELDDLIRVSTSDAPEQISQTILNAMQDLGEEVEMPPIEEFARDMRGATSQMYTSLTSHVELLENRRAEMLLSCNGPLGMRAVRDGIEYTARVCASPLALLKTSIEPTEISRRKVE